jgi:carboxyl-terminal processing protease
MMRFLIFSILMNWTAAFSQSDHVNSFIAYKDSLILTGRDSAEILLDQALSLMKKNYYEKNQVGWDSLATRARRKLSEATRCRDSYSILSDCFKEMKTDHSFIMPAAYTAIYNNDTASLEKRPSMKQWMGDIQYSLPENNIAYLSVPWVATTDPAICTKIADSLQEIIETLDRAGISKWIVDLRNNTGGNCWPMICGMGPLIGSDTCGYFVLPTTRTAIRYSGGRAMEGDNTICTLSRKAYHPKITRKNIAVLVGPRTSSSGEILALAFKGGYNTTLFGEPTAGLTTANTTYPLLDKSMLVLSVCGEADRYGRLCEGKILPDEPVLTKPSYATDDPVLNAAKMWLQIF